MVQVSQKSVTDNTNEILILKNKISDLEQKLCDADVRSKNRRRFNSESQDLKSNQISVNSEENDDKIVKDLKSDLESLTTQLKSKNSEIAGLTSINERLKLEVEEKVHDLKMAQKNMDHLKEMLEEKSSTSESQQQERLQNIAGIDFNIHIMLQPAKKRYLYTLSQAK